ncbi:MAG: cobalamin B12-binding domain-containing protein [Gemmatimonadetes bacterium]|nr:cobalamin B12-binding domain-containing protein [Gemmatimonadota bacterium]
MAADKHPIRVVTTRTGLSADLLRAWETRYRAVVPSRTPGGQRLYSDADIHRLRLLHRATQAGRAIGSIARLPTGDLEAMVNSDESARATGPAATLPESTERTARGVLEDALTAVGRLDGAGLERLLRRAALQLTVPVLLDRVIAPLMWAIGDEWEKGALAPAHEHLASAQVRRVLAEFLGPTEAEPAAPAIVVATPSGQVIEIGALLAAVTAASEGWRVRYFGADLPAAEIVRATTAAGAVAVAVSIGHDTGDPKLPRELEQMARGLAGTATLLVGGRAAPSHELLLRRLGAKCFHDLESFRSWLRTVPWITDSSSTGVQ